MNVALISVSGRLACDGSRLISSILKKSGHKVKNIYLARREPDYETGELEKLLEILPGTDLVMLAVYSNYYGRAVKVTNLVRHYFPGLKVVWGGPHCIATPEMSLKFADIVCFSEGDEAVVQLMQKIAAGEDYSDVPNMAFRSNGRYIINQALPPFADLDSLPYYDYSLDDQFLLDGVLQPLTTEMVKPLTRQYPFYVPTLYFLTSRGCPHTCSYCNNCRYLSMFGKNIIRYYSVDRVIAEIKYTLNSLPFVEFIVFGDDDFLARPKKQLQAFAKRYKQEIGLPFGAAASTRTYRRDKMDILLDAGLAAFNLGIQSGSQRVITEIYDRNISLEKTREVIKDIASYEQERALTVVVDFIIDNPYETREDIMQTYWYLLDIPPSFKPNLFYLSFYPGTPIYQRAKQDGFIQDFDSDLFRSYTGSSLRFQKNYETFLVLLLRLTRLHPKLSQIPKKLFKLLGSPPIRKLAALFPEIVFEKGANALQIKQAWKKKAGKV
jgi:anaerobic magnesium-protoporphyrin IX monomethyl ester cyclase